MKRYRTPREVLAEVDKLAAARPSISAPLAVLDETVELLHRARHYSWIGIYLNAGEPMVRLAVRGEELDPGSARPHSKFAAPMRIVGRELGVIEAESDREHAFGREDRVLLQRVATRLALYLSTRGKHILRRLLDASPPVADAASLDPRPSLAAAQPAAKKSVKPLKSASKSFGRHTLRPASGVTSY